MSKWLLVDGFNLAYRCFFAVPDLTRVDGFPTNAVHGWVKSLWRLQDQEKPDATLVFFDLGGAQDRLALHPEYKAQRAEMPESLVKQLPYVKAVTRAMGLGGIEQEGVESDDLLASQAVALARAGHEALYLLHAVVDSPAAQRATREDEVYHQKLASQVRLRDRAPAPVGQVEFNQAPRMVWR